MKFSIHSPQGLGWLGISAHSGGSVSPSAHTVGFKGRNLSSDDGRAVCKSWEGDVLSQG